MFCPGTTCSPCCATFALLKHVIDHSQPGENVCESIEKYFYMDNSLQSLSSAEEASALVEKLQDLHATGGFDLRQWASNIATVVSHLPHDSRSTSTELWLTQGQSETRESILWLQWHCLSDTLSYKNRLLGDDDA
ncbi:hypothetical protein DPEC_G00156980 [Dallia pectoralis]|uniref:Uncharacterized protein n=1 Tax=Dallia pectoralis TaxID=75939 RepID=A0ACC2GKU8_DALPE|nr:hypothetical protein DPEC_G00156980 [Dallia pectoralis]